MIKLLNAELVFFLKFLSVLWPNEEVSAYEKNVFLER